MITVIDRERIRRAYYIEGKSMRQIERELHHSYWTIRKALASAETKPYMLSEPKPAPKLGPFKAKVDKLLEEESGLPRKQRYTTHKLFELMEAEGYEGSESSLRRYVGRKRGEMKRPVIYIPLQFEPGQCAQVDWGEAVVVLNGQREKVQLFVMRLCYSRRTFVMAFPSQKQEAFFTGHIEAFHYFGGVPHTLIYDNLKTAVKQILKGRNRREQSRFITLRSHYLFESRFCTPGEGHEKGSVEHGVKYVRQNYMVPLPHVRDYAELNKWLRTKCQADDKRQVDRQPETIGTMWQQEKARLRPLPATDMASYVSREVTLNRYGQVVFETNRYSVPAQQAQKQLTLRAYPFRIEIVKGTEIIASHQRCYGRQQDILNPLHYLPLLSQRPGAFADAQPMQRWRQSWPPLYDELLHQLKRQQSDILAVREFIQILQLHLDYDAKTVQTAIEQAVMEGIAHLSGVRFCLNRLLDPTPASQLLTTLPHPRLAQVGQAALSLPQYDQLLTQVRA
ncbi:MAG TPA: IS21 family transposase [Saprospiraceae bacterium]|nr:IS21 family transposase [Saprospiraceae bacterium]